ncbi:hypothetical protein M433DRAFT_234332 [Acidomyces richmondensis BFW]|nr:MAG: hypothetical protein FE78DRAFT_378850 [Acidomyces sp. 'richmondensis']KYG45898.1 hypothetical protein M433DRAFT_234332 [Acidomyces richmondensis BFW]
MLALLVYAISLVGFATAQQTSFAPGTGVRSLWDESQNSTVYVVSCPTASPQCALSPNLTVTEGISNVKYTTSNTAGSAVLDCTLTGSTSAMCSQGAEGGGYIQKTSTKIGADQIVYQAVDVTATMNNTSTIPATVTVTAQQSTTSSTSSSTGLAPTMSSGPWAVGGAIGAGLVALAAL